jgi:hypothetical protein
MSQVRIQVLYGPAVTQARERYGWRLMGANNRELGRHAVSFVSYQGALRAIRHLKRGAGRALPYPTTDPRSGRWGWRIDLDGASVAVSGRWYERDHDARLGAARFVSLIREAAVSDRVVTRYGRSARAGGTR